jgi:GNAT superfamily N-acetyltransferase
MTAGVTITLASGADREALIQLLGAQLDEHAIEIDADALGRAVDGVFADPGRGRLLIARLDGEPVGVAYLSYLWTLEHGGKSAWLDELYVVPARREHGIGTKLLQAVYGQATQDGCLALDLEVEVSHARAARLYAREGFRPHQRARWVRAL